MALTLTNTTLSTTFTSTEVDANFADVSNKFSGGIVNADISNTAAIAASKLAASYQEVWLQLVYSGAAGVWPAAGATVPLVASPLPGSNGDTSWVATDANWVCNDVGTADGSFDVRYGYFGAAGVWTQLGTIATAVTIDRIGGDGTGGQGRASENDNETIAQAAGYVPHIALMSAGAGTNVIDAATGYLSVTVALRRQITA